ncbi:MAG: permease-like cell division protein FtsX [Clostridia bacterium]|nr:permease-like cell division protein FtsX [Clostridia bacterium]
MRYNILSYHIGEGIKNVFKNKKSTVASVGIMVATMFMFGIFFLIGENVNNIMNTIEEDQGIQVFIINEASEDEVEDVRYLISTIDGVAEAKIFTKQQALDQMKDRLKDNKDLLKGYEGDNNIFSDSVVVKLDNLEKSAEVQEQINKIEINGQKYIKKITSSDDTINALIRIANGIRLVTGIILVLLIAISVFIISNTIKLTVHARRKEISIMKYVGATNSFIRSPFIVEGVIIGIISGLITMLIIAGGYHLISVRIIKMFANLNLGVTLLQFNEMAVLISIVYLVLGIGIGVVGSVISMKKYLEV